jgi:hypothetical protein
MANQQRLNRTVEEVRMLEPEVVRKIEALRHAGFGAKRISRELGVARNTVRRYLRGGASASGQRPRARQLSVSQCERAVELFDGVAEANAVVVTEMLVGEGVRTSVRTVQRGAGAVSKRTVAIAWVVFIFRWPAKAQANSGGKVGGGKVDWTGTGDWGKSGGKSGGGEKCQPLREVLLADAAPRQPRDRTFLFRGGERRSPKTFVWAEETRRRSQFPEF